MITVIKNQPTIASMWVEFAAAALSAPGVTDTDAAELADSLVEEFKKRFTSVDLDKYKSEGGKITNESFWIENYGRHANNVR